MYSQYPRVMMRPVCMIIYREVLVVTDSIMNVVFTMKVMVVCSLPYKKMSAQIAFYKPAASTRPNDYCLV